MTGSHPPAPRRVLLTRLSAIGDCILTIPLAVELKRLWPDCHLTWAVSCAASQLLETHPSIDTLLTFDKSWLRKPADFAEIRRDLRSREFDLALDPQGLSKSALLGWLSGAPIRVGFDYSHGREVAPLVATRRIKRTLRHKVDTYRQLLSPWTKIAEGQGQFQMPKYEEAANSADRILTKLGLSAPAIEGWFAINPGAGWPTRIWPVQRHGILAREIFREYGIRSLIFWAGESELLMANVIAEESRGAAVVAPATSLQELVELTRRASLLVTCDTGPLHIASAVGTPTVSLHGVTWADETGPYAIPNVAIQSPLVPHPKKLVRRGVNSAMHAIEVDEVIHGVSSLLASQRAQRRLAA
ncbi:MAG: glycosyltransferase family 9 protein [Planctomycetales bacterium]|nr:glycosyltransferase family 9 protein [Planctomycetales bacterium]